MEEAEVGFTPRLVIKRLRGINCAWIDRKATTSETGKRTIKVHSCFGSSRLVYFRLKKEPHRTSEFAVGLMDLSELFSVVSFT